MSAKYNIEKIGLFKIRAKNLQKKTLMIPAKNIAELDSVKLDYDFLFKEIETFFKDEFKPGILDFYLQRRQAELLAGAFLRNSPHQAVVLVNGLSLFLDGFESNYLVNPREVELSWKERLIRYKNPISELFATIVVKFFKD